MIEAEGYFNLKRSVEHMNPGFSSGKKWTLWAWFFQI